MADHLMPEERWYTDLEFADLVQIVVDLRTALDQSRAAHGVTRNALNVLVWTVDTQVWRSGRQYDQAISSASTALAATEGEGA